MILRLTLLVQCRLVTDRWTDTRRQNIYRASITSRGKMGHVTLTTPLFAG